MRMSDQIRPVLIWTEATFVMLTLSSSLLKSVRLRRVTALSLTSMYVGKNRLPLVHRLALKVSIAIRQSEYYPTPQRNSLRFNPFVEIGRRKVELVNHS